MNPFILGARGVVFLFAVIALGLTGSLAATGHSNSRVSFSVFASAFAVLFGVFFAILAEISEKFSFPIMNALNDFLNAVFTFVAATVLAADIGSHSCSNKPYLDSNNIIQGSSMRCRETQAAIAFLYFAFFTFLALLIVNIRNCFKLGAFTTSRKSGPVNTGIPTLSSP